ncbi:MAG: 50S ribosomal protein L6 [Deltaproteobacteria bacterium]|nr:50S ribosomal protein L6 [Deltaproteobacteria bacterium]
MSRIGRMPIVLEKGVQAVLRDGILSIDGPKGKLQTRVAPGYGFEIGTDRIEVKRPGDSQDQRAIHGLMRKLVANMAEGVSKGFTRVLEINGVGYRAEAKGSNINLTLGYSHPIVYQLPPGVSARVDRQVIITLESADRQLLGSVAAEIRALRPPEPYKGKGIKYANEVVRRKAGKAAAGSSGG